MFKRAVISRNCWYLATDVNDINKFRNTKSAQAIVCFSKTLFGSTQVLFYSRGQYIKVTRLMLDSSDWSQLMRIKTGTLGREADETESFLLNKISKNLTNNHLEHLDQAMHDDAILTCIAPLNHEDEDTVDGCVIS